tara:strand:- start:1026 stop:1700 length:675 start_codon:yes stop_codon:yes gene_type:complete
MTQLELIELVQQHHPTMGHTEIRLGINRAQDDYCARTELIKTSFVQNSEAGKRYYELHSDILKITKVQINDIAIPRLLEMPKIDDDEWADGTNQLPTPASSSNERYWYVDNRRLGVVEKVVDAVTRDDKVSQFQSISEVKEMRIHAIAQATPFTSTLTETSDLPSQFHEALPLKVIADGYLRPPNLNPNLHTVFDIKYKDYVKEGKKYARANYGHTGHIKPIDF